MRCPSLTELPPPPPGATGWPWTEPAPRLPAAPPAGRAWPTISIVTPSFNQGRFIEETIRTVLLQGYPDLEYVIIDGGSTDESVEIIRKYSPWLAHWVSEPDRGQSHAINKGVAAATGDVLGWLCSDDLLLPGALGRVGGYFAEHPDCRWLAGRAAFVALETGKEGVSEAGPTQPEALIRFWQYGTEGYAMPQPSVFWSHSLWLDAGGLREERNLAMDYDLWLRFEERARVHFVDEVLSRLRLYERCKTLSQKRDQIREIMQGAYAAARRRRRSRVGLTAALWAWEVRRRLRLFRSHLTSRWWGGAARQALHLLAAPFRLWTTEGRLDLMRKR